MQRSLTPKPILWGSLRVDTYYQPAHRISGGDFGIVNPSGDECLNLLVGDVSGHRICSPKADRQSNLFGDGHPAGELARRWQRCFAS